MKSLLATTSIALVLTAGAAKAETIANQVINQLSAEGYTRIEVKNGLTQVKVEAIRYGYQLEIIYDAATGAILKQEVEPVESGDDTAPGISVTNRAKDFYDKDVGEDHDDDDHDEDDHD